MVKRVTVFIKNVPDAVYLLESSEYAKIRKNIKLDDETIIDAIYRGLNLAIVGTNTINDKGEGVIDFDYMLFKEDKDLYKEYVSLGEILKVSQFIGVLNEPI